MAEIKDFQKNVCDLPEPIPPPEKVCPTCEEDPSYVEPTWWETDEPYLHKGLCEYRVSVDSKEDPRGLSTNAIKALGYKPSINFSSGIERTITWFSDSRNLRKYKTSIFNV